MKKIDRGDFSRSQKAVETHRFDLDLLDIRSELRVVIERVLLLDRSDQIDPGHIPVRAHLRRLAVDDSVGWRNATVHDGD